MMQERTITDMEDLVQSVSGNYVHFLLVLSNIFSEIYDKALSTGLIQKNVEEIVVLVLAKASQEKRTSMTESEGIVYFILN